MPSVPKCKRMRSDFTANDGILGPIIGCILPNLMDVSGPANTNAFLTRINLATSPASVALASGIAFVAGGHFGIAGADPTQS